MKDFLHIPRNKQSYASSSLICGYGINDSDYMISYLENDIKVHCSYYLTWKSMITRVFSVCYINSRPNNKGCTISEEWLYFSKFREWMIEQDWEDKHLDKDILIPNNKHYSVETCVFVPRELNNFITDRTQSIGIYPKGVIFQNNKFRARCSVDGKLKHLGYYTTQEDAHMAYILERVKQFNIKISEQTDQRIINGLKQHLSILQESQI